MMRIKKDEKKLVGKWIYEDGKRKKDATFWRIDLLVNDYLLKVKTDESGWDTLFKDPVDDRYWELIFENSEMHGGGTPTLINISKEKAVNKYTIEP